MARRIFFIAQHARLPGVPCLSRILTTYNITVKYVVNIIISNNKTPRYRVVCLLQRYQQIVLSYLH